MSIAMNRSAWRTAIAWSIGVLVVVGSPARADDDRRDGPPNPLYRDECGSCHVPFAPRLLPAESWRRVIGQLSDHYGVDASIEAARERELLAWLLAHAAEGRRAVPPPQDRITQSAWFLREHKEVASPVWQRSSVRQPSNCAACHTRADEGSFRERDIVIPK